MTQDLPEATPPGAPRGRGCVPWLIGCGAVTLILVILAGVAAWWYAYRPVQQVYQAIQEVERLDRFDERVTDRAPFDAPADGLLTEPQVVRYLAVQRRIEDALVGRLERLERRFAEIEARDATLLDLVRLASVYTEFFGLLVEVKEAQVEALNAEGFSLDEYAWVRREVVRAAGIEGAAPDLGAFVGTLTGDEAAAGPMRLTEAPEANRELVGRYRDEFEQTAFLALIGL